MDFGTIFLMISTLLLLAFLSSRIISRFGIPGLIGEIAVGILIANLVFDGTSLLSLLDIDMAGKSENYEILEVLAELGVILLLFEVGLETKVRDIISVGKVAMCVAILGVVVPFMFGISLIMIYDGNTTHALFMGAAMVATSVGITAKVIKELNLLDTRESKIIITAAVIDDILGLIVLAMVIGIAGDGFSIMNLVTLSIMAVSFVMMAILLSIHVMPKVFHYLDGRLKNPASVAFIPAIVLCFALAYIADMTGMAAIIGAFLAGMLLSDRAEEWRISKKASTISTLLLPFFFLNVGMQVDITSFTEVTMIALAGILIVLAIVSKYVGCGIGARIGDRGLSKQSRNIIGMGMVPRGEVGIIVASIGLSKGAITPELYAMVIAMAVATTIIAPPILSRLMKGKYQKDAETLQNV